jgi:hypothetical protein
LNDHCIIEVRRGKFIAECLYFKKSEQSYKNNLKMNCKALEKQKQAKPKTSSKKEIIKI